MVSFWAPQSEPARDLRMLRREEALEIRLEMCSEKLKWVSKVTPRIFTVFKGFRNWSFKETLGSSLDSLKLEVKRVTEDLSGAM